FLFFFFFYVSRDHRALHSFPTRRSSDLGCAVLGDFVAVQRHLAEHLVHLVQLGLKCSAGAAGLGGRAARATAPRRLNLTALDPRSEEHTSELQSRENLVCRLLLEKKKTT